MYKLLLAFIIATFAVSTSVAQTYNDRTLASVMSKDKLSRDSSGKLIALPVKEHMFRADVYMSNRQFSTAREHWQNVLALHPTSESVPKALFGMGRSNMWERNYEVAISWFQRLVKEHPYTLDGQEGLAYMGACHVRLGQNTKAVAAYEKYTVMFPFGKRIASSYLNILDAYREDGKYELANQWVDKTAKRFGSLPTTTNAYHARLRMEVYRANWQSVVKTANDLLRMDNFRDSMAFEYEVRYLKGYALEKLGSKTAAGYEYAKIPANPSSYFGGLATDRMGNLGVNTAARERAMKTKARRVAGSYPVKYRRSLLRHASARGVDPRFVLAIMKQESSFRPRAKSPAAARGLLQLTYDTALKYNQKAGYPSIKGTDLYSPEINIAIGTEYIAELKREFGGLYEAIAASYNGGEDNSARWLARSKPKEPAIFASEVGFSETKRYVFKVMGNYRVYRELYNPNLTLR